MALHQRVRALTLTLAAIGGLLAASSTAAAQANQKNLTGLPMYPKLFTGTQYPASQTNEGKYLIYTAQSPDALETVEAWYRHALPKATETRDDNNLTHGIVLKNGKDKVLVYRLGHSKSAVVELQKYEGS
jgi:hypothetical protein